MALPGKASLFLLLISLTHLALGLYEDQVGKFDWRQQYLGSVRFVYRPTDQWQDHHNLIVGTNSGVSAGLHLRNGKLNWRHILEVSPVIGSLEHLQPGFLQNPGQLFDCPLLSVNGYGRWVRCWDEDGLLISEHKLPENFIAEVEKDPLDYQIYYERFFDDNTGNPAFQILRVKFSTRIVETFRYEFKTKEFAVQNKFTADSWLKPATSCSLITSKNWVCASADEGELYVLDHSQKNSTFQKVSLLSFGLKSEKKAKYLKVQRLSYRDDDSTLTISTKSVFAKWKHFALDLGGEGFVLLKIRSEPSTDLSNRVQLVKIFPRATRLTLIPLVPDVEEIEAADNAFAVAILLQNPEALKEQETGEKTHIFAFKLAVFHLGTWTEIKSLQADSIFFEFSTRNVMPISAGGKLAERLNSRLELNTFEIIPIRLPVTTKTGKIQYRYTYKMLLGTVDETLILANLAGKVVWAREEALADVTSAVFLDLPLSDTDATLELEYGFDEEEVNKANIITLFLNRIKSQAIQLKALFNRITNSLGHYAGSRPVARISAKREQELEDQLEGKVTKESIEVETEEEPVELVRDYFGIHKLILLRTRVGKLFAMDSLSGKIVWSKYEPLIALKPNKEARFPIYVQRTSAHYPRSAVCTILTESHDGKETTIYSLDPFTGKTIELKSLPFGVLQAMMVNSIHDVEYLRPILFLDAERRAHLYPSSTTETFAKLAGQYYMMLANETSGLVTGYSFAKSNLGGPIATEAWNFRVPSEGTKPISKLVVVFKRPSEHVHSQGRVLGDRNVLYKYLNPNLVVICWESLDLSAKPQLSIYLVDSITGAIVYSTVHRRSKGPVNIVHSENYVIYSFYNEKLRRNEFSSIELFEGYSQTNSTAFSSIGRDLRLMPLIEQSSFIFPTGLGPMTDTETLKGITNKHILIFLPNGALLELPRVFLDPRRPIRPTPEHAEEGLIPYVPELPVPSEMMINYNLTIFRIKNILTAPTSLESTSLVLAYGLDLFYTRVTPSKTFDVLKDDFDHLLIVGVLVGMVVFSYLAKWFASRKSLNASWK